MVDQELMAQLRAVQAKRRAARHRRFKLSKVDQYRYQLRLLRKQGASLQDLVVWLADNKKVHVHRTTIARRLDLWRRDEHGA